MSEMNKFITAVLIVWGYCAIASAKVQPASIFTDHAVLQQGTKVPVWGTADAGEEITVTFGDQKKSAKADTTGHWRVDLEDLKPGEARDLIVAGGDTVTFHDVLVGEVWLGSGQSNMEFHVDSAANKEAEIKAADYPQIRMFTVARAGANEPATSVKGAWVVCTPATVGRFSAAAYFFGRDLHKALKVPVGLIHSSVGGTPIENWLPIDPTEPARVPTTRPRRESSLYNGMIAPLIPYAIRGALWYQGEANASPHGAMAYRVQLPSLIIDWRAQWGEGDFPFLIVQLPNFQPNGKAPITDDPSATGWSLLREAQQMATTQPSTAMAVTIDIGELHNIHPKNKQDVGHRLALLALSLVYKQDIVSSGPTFKALTIKEDGSVVIAFDSVGGGLTFTGDALTGFWLAGADKVWHRANAKIDGATVSLKADEVAKPVAVRYAWGDTPTCNLTNKEGLPAAPFRTDDWMDGAAPATRPVTRPSK